MGIYGDMTVSEIAKLPGVADLGMTVKVKFIKALKAEDAGNHDEAATYLDEAVKLEQAVEAAKK